MTMNTEKDHNDFIRSLITADLQSGEMGGKIVTRFPPEPNGHLHIGHAKSICLNFGVAAETNGTCHLRFDDTNPTKETDEYVESIKRDVAWLGWDWGEHLYFASDYFEQLYEMAITLIEKGKAYVDDLTQVQIRHDRGTLKEPGTESPYRTRSVEENLDLFTRMRNGDFPDGSRVLRAKIDMRSGNLNLRDPVLYRILHTDHHRTGNKWCIYPMYDLAHGQSDSIEGITHSLCTMEFEDHRPLYDWLLATLGIHHPKQVEFARLNLTHTVLSKRRLLQLVEDGHVTGWDDPRMPTLSGLRRRGYTPEAIKTFCDRIGIAKRQNTVEIGQLEACIREDLNQRASRALGVLRPLKIIIDNYPEDLVEEFEAPCNPEDPTMGTRTIPFSRELYIEADDFLEDPPPKFYRLAPGREVRLRYGYLVTCVDIERDKASGDIIAIHCTYDPLTKGGQAPDGRKVRGTIHWLSARHAIKAEVRLYEHLFSVERPDEIEDYTSTLNVNSVTIIRSAFVEPSLVGIKAGDHYQFERLGYFCVDPTSSASDGLVFNRTVTLRDSWAKALSNKKTP